MNVWLFVLGFVLVWVLAFAWACWAYVLGYNRAQGIGQAEADSLRAMIRSMDNRTRS